MLILKHHHLHIAQVALHIHIQEVLTQQHLPVHLLTRPGSIVNIDHTDSVFHPQVVHLFMEEHTTIQPLILAISRMPQILLIWPATTVIFFIVIIKPQ